ncbi:MAG: ABC transporter permease [Spirochaetaceae bacterium]|nr:ABC transporter permease [Spirochaetaceae bacterium]
MNNKCPLNLAGGLILLAIIIILITGAPFFARHDPLASNAHDRLAGPSLDHPFGTDRYGRDIYSRILYGGRTTLISSFTALGMSLAVGVALGMFTGMFNRALIDAVVMRAVDALMAFPFMVFALVLTALFGASLVNLLIAVIVVWWVPFARLSRSIVLQTKNEPHVNAAKVLGASDGRIIFFELLPKVIGPVFILATFELGTLILSISALSFLGLGAQPPHPEWGSMLSDGRAHFFQAPHILIGPVLFIVLTVLALNLIGEGLRDRLDPFESVRI